MTQSSLRQRHQLTRDDILALAHYLPVRRERRRRLSELKRQRRVEVGPFATFHFENFDAMRHQVREILYIEKGGAAQLEDELKAYNPLIPRGADLVATAMFEIDGPGRCTALLGRLGGIESHAFIDVDGRRVRGEPDPTRENTSPLGKVSAVQFLDFRSPPDAISRFSTPGTQVVVGFDHPNYADMAVLTEPAHATLGEDFD
jgi:Protein of unknown function (DUF3501)